MLAAGATAAGIIAALGCAHGLLGTAGHRPPSADPSDAAGRSGAQFAPSLVGKPYRDLRRHTNHALGQVSGLDVSPDGRSLLFSSTADGPAPNLYLKDLNGAAVVRKTSGRASDIHPRFSPDGRWIAFASNRDGNYDIWIIPAEGAGGAEQVTASPDDDVRPAWSPDGRKLALCRFSPSHGWNLWILDRVDQSAVELGPGLYPDWSPTGEWIAFQKPSEREPYWYGLWIIRPDGSEVRQVVLGDGFGAIEPSWSPAGDLLAFTAINKGTPAFGSAGAAKIWVVAPSHGKMYQITDGPEPDAAPAWGLGGRIYFTSRRDGAEAVFSLVPPEVEG